MKNTTFLICFVTLISCDVFTSKKGFDENNLIKPEDVGVYHKLKEDNIKIYLPQGFKALTEDKIREFFKQIENKETRYFFEKSYESQRLMKGNIYSFYSNEYASEISIQTLPYMTFNKSNAIELLYYLRKSFLEYQKVTGIYHNKIKATYFGEKTLQFFKARYRLTRFNSYNDEQEKENYEMFKIVYLITSKRKTFMITIITPFEENFDPFIRKIKL